jgi:hypothetical protein
MDLARPSRTSPTNDGVCIPSLTVCGISGAGIVIRAGSPQHLSDKPAGVVTGPRWGWKVKQYEAYLRLSSFGFRSGRVELLRLALVPIG